MNNAHFDFLEPKNEPVLNYAPGSPERKALKHALAELKSQERDIPAYIDGHMRRGICLAIFMPLPKKMCMMP
jgi:1-pyrroline-5-carboxylate dehydrogenase